MTEGSKYRKTIAANIKRLRSERNISQQKLADYANVAKSTIQRIEVGNFNASIDLLDRISQVLETDIVHLITP